MARIDLVDPNDSDDPDVREWAKKVTHDGWVANHFKAEAPFPAVMMNVYDARLAIARHPEIGPTTFTKIALAVSMANDCTYCIGAFSSLLSTRLGGQEAAREFQLALAEGDIEGRDRDLIEFVLAVLDDPHGVTDRHFDRLRER